MNANLVIILVIVTFVLILVLANLVLILVVVTYVLIFVLIVSIISVNNCKCNFCINT